MSGNSEMLERVAKAIYNVGRSGDELWTDHNAPDGPIAAIGLAEADAAIEAMREPLLAIIAKEEQGFLSPEYATGQPLSSLQERFACKEVAKAIAAALSEDEGKG
jgi:hypothetical protein